MLRHYLAAALRNLARNRFYSGISVFGLAIGLCAAILMGLAVRHELSHDRFIPGYERIYLGVSVLMPQGRAPDFNPMTHNRIAALLKLRFREIAATTRLAPEKIDLRRGQIEAKEEIYWADRNAFDVLALPVFAGDLQMALQRPDGIVLTRSMARKYFGRDDPIGETIQLQRRHFMTVRAVIEDLPVNGTQLESGIFASGLAAHSRLTALDNDPSNSPESPGFWISVRTYLRLSPNASLERVQKAMPALMDSIWQQRPAGLGASIDLVRIDKVHLFPGLNPAASSRLGATALVGALILLIACVNFINLSTARAARRAMEVGIRKASGAGRSTLMLQFLGESLIYVLPATGIAVALAELSLPHVNAFLGVGAVFNYWHDPALIASIALSALVLGVIAGIYPALVLSAFRPVSVLKGSTTHSRSASATRQGLVILQFAILIALMIAAGVVYQQRLYATQDALRVDTDQILNIRSPCNGAFKTELLLLPGVRGVACSGGSLLRGERFSVIRLKDGSELAISQTPVDSAALSLYGLEPLAGRFFPADYVDGSDRQNIPTTTMQRWIVNETAAQRFGFASPQAAIGQAVVEYAEIVGVVADFSMNSVAQKINPTVYVAEPAFFDLISVKLSGRDIPETLAAVDRLWTATGAGEPIERFFLNDYIQNLYLSVLRQARVFGIFSCIAVLLACLGLLGLSAAATERRTLEIGIRKAMGADTSDVMRFLVWQFIRPVLWASLIAWPVAAFFMNRWLRGFAYHIDLEPWLFALSTVAALVIALLTVTVHCYLVARSNPVSALRYE